MQSVRAQLEKQLVTDLGDELSLLIESAIRAGGSAMREHGDFWWAMPPEAQVSIYILAPTLKQVPDYYLRTQDGTQWTIVPKPSGPQVLKIYLKQDPVTRQLFRCTKRGEPVTNTPEPGHGFRPGVLLQKGYGKSGIKNALESTGRALWVPAKSISDGQKAVLAPWQVSYSYSPDYRTRHPGPIKGGSADVRSIWAVDIRTHPDGDLIGIDDKGYHAIPDYGIDDAAESVAAGLLRQFATACGIVSEDNAFRGRQHSHEHFFQSEVVRVDYAGAYRALPSTSDDTDEDENRVPSVIISTDEFNKQGHESLLVLQCIPYLPSHDREPKWFFTPLLTPVQKRRWTVQPSLLRGLTRVHEANLIRSCKPRLILQKHWPDTWASIRKGVTTLYG